MVVALVSSCWFEKGSAHLSVSNQNTLIQMEMEIIFQPSFNTTFDRNFLVGTPFDETVGT